MIIRKFQWLFRRGSFDFPLVSWCKALFWETVVILTLSIWECFHFEHTTRSTQNCFWWQFSICQETFMTLMSRSCRNRKCQMWAGQTKQDASCHLPIYLISSSSSTPSLIASNVVFSSLQTTWEWFVGSSIRTLWYTSLLICRSVVKRLEKLTNPTCLFVALRIIMYYLGKQTKLASPETNEMAMPLGKEWRLKADWRPTFWRRV